MKLDLLSIRFLIVFLKHKLVHTHTKKRDPNGLMIIEVFTFGQWRSAFTNGVPFIELSRASDEEILLDKYSILVYSVNKRPNDESLRFVMDLRWHSMAKDQKFALISDGSYAQKLTNGPLIDTFCVTFNFRYVDNDKEWGCFDFIKGEIFWMKQHFHVGSTSKIDPRSPPYHLKRGRGR